jgi:hypothetical protein
MHMLRLGIQGIEYATTGALALPIPDQHGSVLRDVRHGKYTRLGVLAMADDHGVTLEALVSTAPPERDALAINQWLLDCHRSQLPVE